MKSVIGLLLATQIYTANASAMMCTDLFKGAQAPTARSVDKIEVKEQRFKSLLDNLRATLSGNLATVWRSEWKTKLTVKRSNEYVFNLVKQNLSTTTAEKVLKGLNPYNEGFTRQVHQRMFELQKKGQTNEWD